MKSLARCAVILGGFALLAGCSGMPVMGVPDGSAVRPGAPLSGAEPLLYVAHAASNSSRPQSVVSIISLPHDKVRATITGYGYITGVCTDGSGDAWVPNRRQGRWYFDKFARGGRKQTQELKAPRKWSYVVGCAVDPSDGDLAAIGEGTGYATEALIWSGARSGKPATYQLPFCPVSAAYDDADNLFVTGWGCGSDFNVYLGELSKGSAQIALIKVGKLKGPLGGVQWDGSYLVVSTSRSLFHPELYRLEVIGARARVVGIVRPRGFFMCCFGTGGGLFVLQDQSVIGMAGGRGDRIWAWPYPEGGNPIEHITRYARIKGIALSI